MSSRPKSTFVISLTAFDADGRLDEAGLRAHYARLRDAGIGVYVAGSGSGEAYTLTDAERQRVLEIAAEELGGHVPVRGMGKEPRRAEEMIEFGRAVEAAGLEAMQVYSLDMGHGVKPTPGEIETYLDTVLSSIAVKAIISTHYFSGYTIPLDVLERVVGRHDNVIGVNCTVPDHSGLGYLTQMIDAIGERVEIHTGGPTQALSVMALGGTGYLASEANIAPRLCVSVTDHFNAGDHEACQAAWAKVIRLYAMNRYGSIRGVKAANEILGLPGGRPRLPRLAITDEQMREVAAALRELDIEELGAAA